MSSSSLATRASAAAAPDATGQLVAETVDALLEAADNALRAMTSDATTTTHTNNTDIGRMVVDAAAPVMRMFARRSDNNNAAALDELVFVTPVVPCSTRALMVLLRLRTDLLAHEVQWRTPEAQVRLSDLMPDGDDADADDALCRKYFDAVMRGADEPVVFWGLRRTMALLNALARLWTDEDGAAFDLENMVLWTSRRLGLLLTFAFPATTLDMVEYRTPAGDGRDDGEPMFAANAALLWDVAARLAPMFRDIDHAHARGYPRVAEAQSSLEDVHGVLDAHVRRCVYRMHGDTLPGMYARCTVARAARLGNVALYARMSGGAAARTNATPRPLDVLRVCCGEAYAQEVHDRSQRPIRDVVERSGAQVDDALLAACCEYYAGQRKFAWDGGVTWVPIACRWATYAHAQGDERVSYATYAEAVHKFVTTRWPASATSTTMKTTTTTRESALKKRIRALAGQ